MKKIREYILSTNLFWKLWFWWGIRKAMKEIKAREGKIIAVVTEGDTTVKELADYIMEVPKTTETLSPLVTTIPLQLLSYHIAVMLGKNVDQPRNLAKSVTVE